MNARTRETDGRPAGGVTWKTLVVPPVALALAVGALLGVTGLRTSGFALSLTQRQVFPILLSLAALYVVVTAAVLFVTLRARRRTGDGRATERAILRTLLSVTLWAALTLTFLPLKGSEAFVRADTLTTLQLNVIGLVVVLVAGLLIACLLTWTVSALISLLRRRLPGLALPVLGAVVALVAIVVLAVGVRGRAADGAVRAAARGGAPQRVAVIGIDGCDWEKLGPLVDAGRLPNFQRLMERGAYGPLWSEPPLISPRIWTTIATGKTAEKHGIHDFVNEDGVPVNAAMRSASTVWEIVSDFGLPVGVVGWYVTWPVEEVNGFILSDRLHSLLRGPVQMLQSAGGRPTNERLESFGSFSFDAGYKRYLNYNFFYPRFIRVNPWLNKEKKNITTKETKVTKRSNRFEAFTSCSSFTSWFKMS